jgi:hypothetical protein
MGSLHAALGLAGYIVGTLLLVTPLLLIHRRTPAPWTATTLVVPLALFPVVTREFPGTVTAGSVAAIVGAVIVDLILVRLDRVRGLDAPGRLPIAGVLFAVVVWSANLLGLQLAAGIQWPVELWTGVVVLSAAVAGALGILATAPRTTTAETPTPAATLSSDPAQGLGQGSAIV